MIEVGKKYGCLTVLDSGEEYAQSKEYSSANDEQKSIIADLRPYIEERQNLINENPSLSDKAIDKVITETNYEAYRNQRHLTYEINTRLSYYEAIELKLDTHYKCQCTCGRVHFFNTKTLETKPKYCYYPIPISTKFTYSIKANNATYQKKQKYKEIECVTLRDKSECVPSDEYCDLYNRAKAKELEKKDRKLKEKIASIPRVFADNYNIGSIASSYPKGFPI